MCVAVPAEILELLGGGKARAVYGGNIFEIDVRLVDCGPGERVLVHAGCAGGAVDEGEASRIDALLAEIVAEME